MDSGCLGTRSSAAWKHGARAKVNSRPATYVKAPRTQRLLVCSNDGPLPIVSTIPKPGVRPLPLPPQRSVTPAPTPLPNGQPSNGAENGSSNGSPSVSNQPNIAASPQPPALQPPSLQPSTLQPPGLRPPPGAANPLRPLPQMQSPAGAQLRPNIQPTPLSQPRPLQTMQPPAARPSPAGPSPNLPRPAGPVLSGPSPMQLNPPTMQPPRPPGSGLAAPPRPQPLAPPGTLQPTPTTLQPQPSATRPMPPPSTLNTIQPSAPTLPTPPAAPAGPDGSPSLLQKPSLRRPEGLLQRPEMRRAMAPPAPAVRPQGIRIISTTEVAPARPPAGRPSTSMPQPRRIEIASVPPLGTPATPGAPGQQGQGGQMLQTVEAVKPVVDFVVEEDGEGDVDEDEEDGKKKGKKKGKKVLKRAEKVTAEMKRKAREMRKAERESKRVVTEQEEIFEVGEEGLSVQQLAEALQINLSDVIMALFMKGIVCTANQQLDRNTVKLVAKDYDVLVLDKEDVKVTDMAKKKEVELEEADLEGLQPRPPVVTVMGHVDHGKTSLLDYIRKSRVAAGEAGGITQQIGAYTTEVESEGESKTICFLDTPGHEAFSAMRARGARVTDIAIIIVAADDGVQPQTREAISHAQAAEVPILVAINKVDKPGADAERTKSQLTECGLVPEEWGGSTPMVPLSAKTGLGMEDLMLNILLMAEELGLQSNPDRPAQGTVVEAHLDRKSGPVTTVLVQSGTLRPGDAVRAGASYGKVRTLSNDMGRNLPAAGPSIAVQILGLSSVPQAGDDFEVLPSEARARELAEQYGEAMREQRLAEMSAGGSMVTLSSLATMDEDVDVLQRLNLVVRGDTQGVVEAIKSALNQLPQDSVALRFLWAGAGDITQADVDLAAASQGLLLAFNLQPSEAVLVAAKRQGVELRTYKVIYDLIDDVRAAMEGKLSTVEERTEIGKAEVKAVFGSGNRRVAGCGVLEGRLRKGCTVVVTRKKEVVYEGPLNSLRRVKDVVDEISAGQECGVAVDGFTEWKEGDIITAVEISQKTRTLEEAKAKSVSLDDEE